MNSQSRQKCFFNVFNQALLMVLSWRKRDVKQDLSTAERNTSVRNIPVERAESWRRQDGNHDRCSEERKVLTRVISVKKEAIGLIIGSQGSNIKRLGNMVGVITVDLDSVQCKVEVSAYTNVALDAVEKDLQEAASWIKKDGNHDILSEETKVLTRVIPIQEEDIGLIIGSQGNNIKRLENIVLDVIKINLDKVQCKVEVRAYTNVALDSVEEGVQEATNWIRRDGNDKYTIPNVEKDLQDTGSWVKRDENHDINREERKVLIRVIPILKHDIGLVIGFQGANIKRLGDMVDVTKVSVDKVQCKVEVIAYTNFALDAVENDVCSMMAKSKIVATLKKIVKHPKSIKALCIEDTKYEKKFVFESTSDCIFEVLRFCSLFGVDPKHIQEGMCLSMDDIETDKLCHILDFQEHWNTNMSVLDSEIIWNRSRHLFQSNYIKRVLVTTNFLQFWDTYYLKLNVLRCFSGIDFVEVDCDEDAIIMELVIGGKSKNALDSCVAQAKSYFNSYLDSLTVHTFCKENEENTRYFSCIPYACASHKLCKKSQSLGLSYLKVIFDDPEVIFVELNELEQTLTMGCSSQAKLDQLLFEVRGKMSFYKTFARRRIYRESFKCYIMVPDYKIRMDAIFGDAPKNELPFLSAEFTDIINGVHLLRSIQLLESSRTSECKNLGLNSESSYALFNEPEILSDFYRFIKFVDLPILDNVHVQAKFGATLYKTNSRTKRTVPVSELLDKWESGFKEYFSMDLKPYLKQIFLKCLSVEGFKEIGHQHFTDVFFSDLGNNLRFTARIETTEPISNTFEVKHCKADHLNLRVIDIESTKCATEIKISSQKICINTNANEFVLDAMESGEVMKENVMSMNSRYSMYNVSIVDRTVFQHSDFIIHLDSVSKKSNQRFGKFSDVINLTLHCPCLNDAICELQKNSGNETLQQSTLNLFVKFMTASLDFSEQIDNFLKFSED